MFLQENNTLTGHIIRYTLLVPPWPCTGSVREGSLGETHICVGPRGQLCASASVQRVPSDREKNNWQWDVSGEANRSTWASPKRLQISWSTSGWSRHSSRRVGWRESSSAARLSLPGTWTAWSDLRCFWLQRRRWRASCDMRRERRPPWWLMYAMVPVLSVRTSTCFSCSSVLKWRRASHTASNLRQLICHCSWSPVQSPAAACPLHMAPQPVVETSVDTTTCLDTCARGTPARRKARSDHVLKVWRQDGVTKIRYVPWRHAHLGTRSWS